MRRLKIKKVDDKPRVIHTKKKAKPHTHEPKKVSVPMTFVKVGKNEFQVIYDELITRKYWDGPIGLKL